MSTNEKGYVTACGYELLVLTKSKDTWVGLVDCGDDVIFACEWETDGQCTGVAGQPEAKLDLFNIIEVEIDCEEGEGL